MPEPLTEAIDARIRQREVAGWEARHALPPPEPDSWAAKQVAKQEAARQERVAAARAEEERVRRVREAIERRRAEEWQRNAPARQAAQAELAKIEQEMAALDAQRERLEETATQLEAVASR